MCQRRRGTIGIRSKKLQPSRARTCSWMHRLSTFWCTCAARVSSRGRKLANTTETARTNSLSVLVTLDSNQEAMENFTSMMVSAKDRLISKTSPYAFNGDENGRLAEVHMVFLSQ